MSRGNALSAQTARLLQVFTERAVGPSNPSLSSHRIYLSFGTNYGTFTDVLTRQERHTVLVGRQPACRHRRETPAQPPCLRSHSWSRRGSERRSRAVCGRLDRPLQPGRERGAAGTAPRAHGPTGARARQRALPGQRPLAQGTASTRRLRSIHRSTAWLSTPSPCALGFCAAHDQWVPSREPGRLVQLFTLVHRCRYFYQEHQQGSPCLTVVPGYVFSRCRAEGGCVTRSPGVRITTQVQQSRMPACHS